MATLHDDSARVSKTFSFLLQHHLGLITCYTAIVHYINMIKYFITLHSQNIWKGPWNFHEIYVWIFHEIWHVSKNPPWHFELSSVTYVGCYWLAYASDTHSSLRGHLLPALAIHWTHTEAHRHITTPINHMRPFPTALKLLLISCPTKGRRLSWPEHTMVSNLLKVACNDMDAIQTHNVKVMSAVGLLYH